MATVLIVDDDPAILEVLTAYLVAEGHSVETEDDGLAALPRLARADVAILDWMLPGMTGVELTAHARREHPQLPVLLLTARGEEEDRLRGLNAGADDYVVKPFSAADVLPAIDIARARWAERKALESEVADLGERFETRKRVDRAKGLLMNQLKLTEADAFRWIQKAAMDRRLSMREVADAVIAGMPGKK